MTRALAVKKRSLFGPPYRNVRGLRNVEAICGFDHTGA